MLSGMVVSPAPMVTDVKCDPENAPSPIEVTESGITYTPVRPVGKPSIVVPALLNKAPSTAENAVLPGSTVYAVRLVPLNGVLPNVVRFGPKEIVVNPASPWKALVPIDTKPESS